MVISHRQNKLQRWSKKFGPKIDGKPPSPWSTALRQHRRSELNYLVHIDNLESILAIGILSKNEAERRGILHEDISLESVQGHRAARRLGDRPLHDFVPLYFAPKTPMSSRLRERNEVLCLLVVGATKVCGDADELWVSDGNAATGATRFFPDPDGLDHVNWAVIDARYWADEIEFPDGKRQRSAELLVYPRVRPMSLTSIEVVCDQTKNRVNEILRPARDAGQVASRCYCQVSPWNFIAPTT